jgi:hypothetical protein
MSRAPDAHDCEALMAGTLCLMSCFADRPRPEFGRKVAENLRVLAGQPSCSPELRTILQRLAVRWDRLSQAPVDGEPADAKPRQVH